MYIGAHFRNRLILARRGREVGTSARARTRSNSLQGAFGLSETPPQGRRTPTGPLNAPEDALISKSGGLVKRFGELAQPWPAPARLRIGAEFSGVRRPEGGRLADRRQDAPAADRRPGPGPQRKRRAGRNRRAPSIRS